MKKEKRGYILTGDPAFIESYKQATTDFYTYHGYLSVLVGNEPAEVTRLNGIRRRLEIWITRSAVPDIEARRKGEIVPGPEETPLRE